MKSLLLRIGFVAVSIFAVASITVDAAPQYSVNVVNLYSDGMGLAGLGIAHNGALPTITTGVASAGQIHIETTGPLAGVISLDYGYYDKALNMGAIAGGSWFLGNSQQSETYYFNGSLGAAANGKYLLGAGGAQNWLNIGSVSVGSANTRTGLFENVLTGGVANNTRVEIGALTADLFENGPSFVNGNGLVVLPTRNTTLTGDIRVNTNSQLAIGNNFALGTVGQHGLHQRTPVHPHGEQRHRCESRGDS